MRGLKRNQSYQSIGPLGLLIHGNLLENGVLQLKATTIINSYNRSRALMFFILDRDMSFQYF